MKMDDLLAEYVKSDRDLKRAREALSFMRMCLASSVLGVVAQFLMFYKLIVHDSHWWWLLIISWAAIAMSEVFKSQAKKIYPEGFYHD